MPWSEKLWDTPNVAHGNPTEAQFHASLLLGMSDAAALRAFFSGGALAALAGTLPDYISAVHAYEVSAALTYVRGGKIVSPFED